LYRVAATARAARAVLINAYTASGVLTGTVIHPVTLALPLASCCLCLVGGITSPERVAELKNLLKRVTFWVVVLQLIMFIVSLACGGGFASLDENPLIGPSVAGLVNSGAKYTYAILHGGVHRLVIPVLLHANIFHLLINIWVELVVCMYASSLSSY